MVLSLKLPLMPEKSQVTRVCFPLSIWTNTSCFPTAPWTPLPGHQCRARDFLTCQMQLIRFPTSCMKAPKQENFPSAVLQPVQVPFSSCTPALPLCRDAAENWGDHVPLRIVLLSCPPQGEAASFQRLPPLRYCAPVAWLWKTYTIFFLFKTTFITIIGYFYC